MKRIMSLLISFCMVFVFSGCKDEKKDDNTVKVSETTTQQTTKEPEKKDSKVSFLCAGDNLIHDTLYQQAKSRAGGNGYDFDFLYKNVENTIKGHDLAILNQESPVCNDIFQPSSYPCFNSPTQVGDKMVDLGFNAFSLSNNHILDKGEKGVLATLDYWDKKNVIHYGAYRDKQDLDTVHTKEINGIKFSFVGFTEHTNGIKLKDNSQAQIVYNSDLATMEKMIKDARKVSDCVVVSVHWGNENSNVVADRQKTLARQFVSWGANLIIGTHPHVVQSMEYLDAPDGSKAFVIYSLGNFVSAQSVANNLIGMVVDLNIVKSGKTGIISFEDIKAKPIITHYGAGYQNVQIYTYSEYNYALASKHGVNSLKGKMSMNYIDDVLEKNISQEFLYLK